MESLEKRLDQQRDILPEITERQYGPYTWIEPVYDARRVEISPLHARSIKAGIHLEPALAFAAERSSRPHRFQLRLGNQRKPFVPSNELPFVMYAILEYASVYRTFTKEKIMQILSQSRIIPRNSFIDNPHLFREAINLLRGAEGIVLSEKQVPISPGQPLSSTTRYALTFAEFQQDYEGVQPEVIYRAHNNIYVVDKPAGLVSCATPKWREGLSVDEIVRKKYHSLLFRLATKHEQGVSGIALGANDFKGIEYLEQQSKNQGITTEFIGLTDLRPRNDVGELQGYVQRSRAPDHMMAVSEARLEEYEKRKTQGKYPGPRPKEVTIRYECLGEYKGFYLVSFKTETAVKHAVRVMAAHAGFPLARDKKYNYMTEQNNYFLHAAGCIFTDMKQNLVKCASIPPWLYETQRKEVLKRFREQEFFIYEVPQESHLTVGSPSTSI